MVHNSVTSESRTRAFYITLPHATSSYRVGQILEHFQHTVSILNLTVHTL